MDPASLSFYFEKRFRIFFNKVICDPNGIVDLIRKQSWFVTLDDVSKKIGPGMKNAL